MLVRKEIGCEYLEVLVDPKLKSKVYVYELWRDRDAWDVHMNSDASATWQEKVKPLVNEESIKVLNSA